MLQNKEQWHMHATIMTEILLDQHRIIVSCISWSNKLWHIGPLLHTHSHFACELEEQTFPTNRESPLQAFQVVLSTYLESLTGVANLLLVVTIFLHLNWN